MTKADWFMVLDATCPGFKSYPCSFGQPTGSDFAASLESSFIMKACRPLYEGELNAKLPRASDVLVLGPVADEPNLRVLSLRRGFDAIGQRGGNSMGASLFIRAPLDAPLHVDGEAAYRLLKAGLEHMDSFRDATGRLDAPAPKMARSFDPPQELVQALDGMEVSSEPMRRAPPIAIVDASATSTVTRDIEQMGLFIEKELGVTRGKSLLFSEAAIFVHAVHGDKESYDPAAYASAKLKPTASVVAQGEEGGSPSAKTQAAGAVPSEEVKSVHQFGPAAEALLKAVEQVAAADPKFRDAVIERLAPKGPQATL